MRNIILYLHISLDDVVADPDQWMLMNDDILNAAIEYYKTIDTILFGSKTYPFLADYWQNAEKAADSPIEKEFAKQINKTNKLVLSRSSIDLVWQNSQLLKFKDIHSLSTSLNNLRQQEGKDISVESGIGIWKLFLEHALFDELLLLVHPVIAGKGEKLFSDMKIRYELKLKSSKTYENGVTELRYVKTGHKPVTDNTDSAAVKAVIDNWAKAVRNKDMEGILTNHTADVLMYDVIAPFQSVGLAAYRKTWELFYKYSTGGDGSFDLTDLKITAGNTVAFAFATLNVFKIKIRLTLGLIKSGGRWLIAHEHHSGLDE